MIESLLEGKTFLRIPAKHFSQQVDAIITEPLKDALYVVFTMNAKLLNLLSEVLSWLIEELGPFPFGWVANYFADSLKLMDLGITLEQRNALFEKLSNDAANGPNIHRFAVFLDLQEQFRGTIPKGDYFASKWLMWFFYKV